MGLVAQCVHGLPKPGVLKSHQLAGFRQPCQWLGFPDRLIAGDVVDALWREDEESTVNPASVAARLFDKTTNSRAFHRKRAISTRRLHRGDRRELTVGAMKRDQLRDIEIGDTIA